MFPLQITLALSHSDSRGNFFKQYDKWTELSTFDVGVQFVWITLDQCSVKEHKACIEWPRHKEWYIPFRRSARRSQAALQAAQRGCSTGCPTKLLNKLLEEVLEGVIDEVFKEVLDEAQAGVSGCWAALAYITADGRRGTTDLKGR
jgi:hypothetical protein